jgi:demethylspheroidene O-methyltransferase
MSGFAGADSVSAYFGMYLLAMGSGRPRSFAALRELLITAGFSSIHRRPTRIPMIAAMIVAHR